MQKINKTGVDYVIFWQIVCSFCIMLVFLIKNFIKIKKYKIKTNGFFVGILQTLIN